MVAQIDANENEFQYSAAAMRLLALIPLLAVLGVAGCGDDYGGARAAGRLDVVATTTQVADFARNVGGSHVNVVQLLAPNTDPHEYELRPQDVKAVADADVVLRSGGDVDDWLDEAIKGSGTNAPVVDLSHAIPLRGDDPHWWQDPRNAVTAIAEIEIALQRVDPAHKAAYTRSTAAYSDTLRTLDRGVRACIDKVPPAQRKLVTTHDALGYYARHYGIDVIGTVIPSLSTAGQPSAGDTANLIATIRRTGVRAIFAESSVNPKVEQAIAQETGAKVGTALWADTLGPSGSDGATYVQSIESNTKALVDGFTGGAVRCSF
jgi:zinc/manganese transport system substrate-binding protein